ncbi:MAG: LysR family transcriptional regulator [Clostridia bacterium]|nr:LysR family transcriptional regulator [Clostridia bacterium]
MELLQLMYFCDAAKTENFSRTAEKYKVPTSNISQTVKRLEAELGVKLFRRSANKVCLSEEGKLFYGGAKRALDALEEAKSRISDLEEEGWGEIRLLIRTDRRIVTNAIEKFKQRCPRVSLSINHRADSALTDYDFIISDAIERAADYRSEHLLSERIVLAVEKNAPLAEGPINGLESLAGERFIALADSRLHSLTEQMCRAAGFTPNVVIRTDDPHYVRKYVEMGLGIALVPAVSWRGAFSDNVVLLDIGGYTRQTRLYIPKDKVLTREERIFYEILVSTFNEEAGSFYLCN